MTDDPNAKLRAIVAVLEPYRQNHRELARVGRALLGVTMGDDAIIVAIALGLLLLWSSVQNNVQPDGTVSIPAGETLMPFTPDVTIQPVGPAAGDPSSPSPIVAVDPNPVLVAAPTQTGAGDQIDPASLQIVASFDMRGYPITAHIDRVLVSPNNVQIFTTGMEHIWPAIFPPGFAGGINFTVWLVLNLGGQWVCSGFIQGLDNYHGSDGVGDGIFDFPTNWYYDQRWSPMTGHAIAPGEVIGLFLTAGNARDGEGPEVPQRTQIVTLPATDSGEFSF